MSQAGGPDPLAQVAGGYERDFGESLPSEALGSFGPPYSEATDLVVCMEEQCLEFMKTFQDKSGAVKYKDMMVNFRQPRFKNALR